MKIFFLFSVFFFVVFCNSYWLKCDMIQQGLRLEDGQGFLTLRVSYGIRSHAGGGLKWPSSPDSEVFSAFSEANPLTEQNITDLYNLSPGENKKTVIVRPASSVVFSLYLHKWLLKDSCVSATSASRSIHLCSVEKSLLFRAQPTLKRVAFLLVN